jgi:hypothetical protein
VTDAERALIEAALTNDRHQTRGGLYTLAQKVAMERMTPEVVAEYKQKLRAHMRAEREWRAMASKLPSIALDGGYGLNVKLWDEIEKEEGWE